MKKIISIALLFCLTACSYNEYLYTLPESDVGKLCVATCQQTRSQCESDNQREDNRCRRHEEQMAQMRYQNYLKEQKALGNKAKKSAYSFNESWRCNSSTQDCEEHYRNCFKSCGGHIRVITHG